MNCFKHLLPRIRLCSLMHLPKLALSVLLMGLLSYAAFACAASPVALAFSSGSFSSGFFIVLAAASFAAAIINNMLLYGFFVLTYLLYTDRRAVLGHLFTGFRDFVRALKAALFFMIVYAFVLSAAGVSIFFLLPDFSVNRIQTLFFVLLILALCTLTVLYLRYGFVWLFLYDDPTVKTAAALRKSAALVKKKRFDFFLLCVQSGGLYLVCALVLLVFSVLSGKVSLFSAVGIALTRMLSTLCMYVSFIRISTAFVAVYEAFRTRSENGTAIGIEDFGPGGAA